MFNLFNNKQKVTLPKRKTTKNKISFDFAFSFSGEEARKKVIETSKKLESLGFKVFVDKWYTKEMQQVYHPKEFLTDVFTNAKYIIIVLNHKYVYMLEKKYNCDKDFNPNEGCYIKHEINIIANRFKKDPICVMRIKLEEGRFDLDKYGININAIYDKLNCKIILDHFEYKDKSKKLNIPNKGNKLQIKEKIEKLFNFHNINFEEWPLIVEKFTYDVIEKNRFYKVIDPILINKIADKFKIDKQFFYNNSNEIYKIKTYGFYKNVKNFSDYVYNEIYTKNGKMYIFSEEIPNKEINRGNENNRFALIFQIPIFEINNKQIYTYEIYDDSCKWGYWKCRYNLKSFLLCLKEKGVFDSFWQGSIIQNEKSLYENLENISLGNTKFESLINRIDWYPGDFIDSFKQSTVAKESDELEEIKQKKCESYY